MQIAGVVTIQVNGKTLRTIPGAEIDLGGYERTAHGGTHDVYDTEEFKPAMITCRCNLARGDSITELQNLRNAVVSFALDTGQTYIVRDAFRTKNLPLRPGENGTVQLEICGKPATEVK
jgi:hypothetical protein